MKRNHFLQATSLIALVGTLTISVPSFTQQAAEMTTYTVQQGQHFSRPFVFKFKRNPKHIHWDIVFDKNCAYTIYNTDGSVSNDQYDWNKLCGVFFNLINTLDHTAMIAWRYNIDQQLIELAPYYHIASSRDMFPPLMTLSPGQLLSLDLTINWESKMYEWTLSTDEDTQHHQMPFVHTAKTCGFIKFYFGGNQTAPNTMSCQMARRVD